MNKKILLKTLLPISTIALIGGGIASSLILTNCSDSITFKSINDIDKYLSKHAVKLSQSGDDFTYNDDTKQLNDAASFYNFVYNKYSKQAYINGVLACWCGGSGVFEDGGKIILKNNNSISISNADGLMTLSISKFNHLNDYSISHIQPNEIPWTESWNSSQQISSHVAQYDEDNNFSRITLEFSNDNNEDSTEIYFSNKDLEKSDITFSPYSSSIYI